MPEHKNSCPRDNKINNFGRPFLGHHYSTFSLSDLCLGVEKKIFKESVHFHYMTIMTTSWYKIPYPGGHIIYNLSRPFNGYHYYALLNLSESWQRVEEEIFKRFLNTLICDLYQTTPSHKNPCTGGYVIYTFGKPFLGHHYYILSLSGLCLGFDKYVFK